MIVPNGLEDKLKLSTNEDYYSHNNIYNAFGALAADMLINDYSSKYLLNLNQNKYTIFDTADYIIPASENRCIFIMTNFLMTEQTQGLCDEELTKQNAICKDDADCQNLGSHANSWNGIPTGSCVNSSVNMNVKSCEIKGWCPVEHESERFDDNVLRNVFNFTILIKNDIEFKKFNIKLRNILPRHSNKYISSCSYHEKNDPYCPVFKLDYILSKIESSKFEKYEMLAKGGVILIEILWDCDFDFESECMPKYFFQRFDERTSTASGYNFRFANKFKMNDTEYRVLFKAYGLRFIINVSGTGHKFSIVAFTLSIGAGLGLISIATYITDIVVLNFGKNKYLYRHLINVTVKVNSIEDCGENTDGNSDVNNLDYFEGKYNKEHNARDYDDDDLDSNVNLELTRI